MKPRVLVLMSECACTLQALKKLKAVCLRLSFGPCISETCTAAVLAYLFMHLPWQWGFILG